MALPLLESQADPSLNAAPSVAPAPGATPDSGRSPARSRRAQAAEPKTSPAKPARGQKTPIAVSDDPADHSPSNLVLDPAAVADVEGLEQEVAVLRASIRLLAGGGDMAAHVKVLAELRHQVEALCRALKTQRALAGRDDNGQAAEMDRRLEELGDDLGVDR